VRTDTVPEGKKDNGALRDLEKKVQRDIDDDIAPEGDGHTVLSLVKKYISQKTGTLVYIDITKTYAGKRVIPMAGDSDSG
jgi:hypothetical protein